MSDRYTRKDAYSAFTRLASALGKTWSDEHGMLWRGNSWEPQAVPSDYEPERQAQLWTRVGTDNRAAVGAWMLDHNGVYGGYVVEVMSNDGRGVSQPFGSMRRPAREFCDSVNFALNALSLREKVAA